MAANWERASHRPHPVAGHLVEKSGGVEDQELDELLVSEAVKHGQLGNLGTLAAEGEGVGGDADAVERVAAHRRPDPTGGARRPGGRSGT